jgi:hypothetical protein
MRLKRLSVLDLLAPIHAGFAEGFGIADLVEARAPLGRLR